MKKVDERIEKVVNDIKKLCRSQNNIIVDKTPLGDCSIKKVTTMVYTDEKGCYSIENYKGNPKIIVLVNQIDGSKIGFNVSEYKKHRINRKTISIDLKDGQRLKLAI